jgi:membrane protein YqaA with SNARE-associated domain
MISAGLDGYLALFAVSFAAATLLPLSSELMLTGFATSGAFDVLGLWLVASLGNVGGAIVNWSLGVSFQRWKDHRWFPFTHEQLDRASCFFARYGAWTLLFAWLPVIGDPLTLIAGVLGVRFTLFLALVAIGKAGRYAMLLGLIEGLRS